MIPLLDTHQHLIYPAVAGYSWTDDITELSGRTFTLADYKGLTDGKSVARSIFMETGVDDADYRSEARFVSKLAADPASGIAGMIASCRPEADAGFDAWIEECADMPVVGFRRILHEIDDDLSRSEVFRSNVRKLGARGLTFDMVFLARQLPIAMELVRACGNTFFVLDHCGVPDIASDALDPWRRYITELAGLPNVACKVSGVMAYCAPGTASLENIRPYVAHVVDSFGPDRLVWGSDWPVVDIAHGLIDWIDVTREFMAGMSQADARSFAAGNAAKIYLGEEGGR